MFRSLAGATLPRVFQGFVANVSRFGLATLMLVSTSSTSSPAQDVQDVSPEVFRMLQAWPGQEPLASHFPVPLVYADWEQAVTATFGRMSLARYNEHLYQDLAPCKAERVPVPVNEIAIDLVQDGSPEARNLLLQGLKAPKDYQQWSIIGVLDKELIDEFAPEIASVATSDPDNTDRAFAYKAIARSEYPGRREILKRGLFDDYQSNRLLCTELLAQTDDASGDGLLLMPIQGLNPFHFYFLASASRRVLPDKPPKELFTMPHEMKCNAINDAEPSLREDFLSGARNNKHKTYAQLVLWLHGSTDESMAAETKLEKLLLDQGAQEDVYLSNDFWLRMNLTNVLISGSDEQLSRLADLFRRHLANYDQHKEMLLVTLAYVFQQTPPSDMEDELVQIGSLETDNYDLYLGAALALSAAKSKAALPALAEIIRKERRPYADVALATLERMTGLEHPGKPIDHGIFHKIGMPEQPVDYAAASDFWITWFNENQAQLSYDEQRGRFVVGPLPSE